METTQTQKQQETIKNPILFHEGDEVYYIGNEKPWAYNMQFTIKGKIYYNHTFKINFASYLENDEYYLRNVPIHDLSHYQDTTYPPKHSNELSDIDDTTTPYSLHSDIELYQPKWEEDYFYISDTGEIKHEYYNGDTKEESEKRFKYGNYFYTVFEAKRMLNVLKDTIQTYHFNRHNAQ